MSKDDFLPTASLETLRTRAEILKWIRNFFDQREFLEVETPVLSHDTCIDRHLHPIGVPLNNIISPGSGDLDVKTLWLQTSPEFGMKRLLAAGAKAIYQITKAFRGAEQGSRHNPEFTMLEWYRVGDNLQSGMKLLTEFIQTILRIRSIDWISYRDLFQQRLSFDPHRISASELFRICQNYMDLQHLENESGDRDFYLNLLLSQVIEVDLGFERPAIVYDWPATQSALAVVRNEDPPVAERFELFVNGLEIANGYHELLDPAELRTRNRRLNELRKLDGANSLPEESRLLAAMERGIPACAGVALGLDRLMMLVTGAATIEEVIAFPFERA
jgi:elongation factor P--(R)-beta-lysine ligase